MADPQYSVVIVAVEVILATLTTLILILRIISRKLSKAGLWHDDRLIIAAYPFAMLMFIAFMIAGMRGAGTLNPDTKFVMGVIYFGLFVYLTCIVLIKLSVLYFYYRIFARNRHFTYALLATGVLVCLWWIAFVPVIIAYCLPIQIPLGLDVVPKCLPLFYTLMGNAIPNIVLDFVLLILPMRPLWKLQMVRRQKIALTIVFILGYLNPIVSIIRMVVIVDFAKMVNGGNYPVIPFMLWTTAELAIGIVSSSIPNLTYLFRRALRPSRKPAWNNLCDARDYSKQPLDGGVVHRRQGLGDDSVESFRHNGNDFVYTTHQNWYSSTTQHKTYDVMPDFDNQIRAARNMEIGVHEVSSG